MRSNVALSSLLQKHWNSFVHCFLNTIPVSLVKEIGGMMLYISRCFIRLVNTANWGKKSEEERKFHCSVLKSRGNMIFRLKNACTFILEISDYFMLNIISISENLRDKKIMRSSFGIKLWIVHGNFTAHLQSNSTFTYADSL